MTDHEIEGMKRKIQQHGEAIEQENKEHGLAIAALEAKLAKAEADLEEEKQKKPRTRRRPLVQSDSHLRGN